MNAFDFVVTVALGSTLATVLLSSSVSLARGMLAFVVQQPSGGSASALADVSEGKG